MSPGPSSPSLGRGDTVGTDTERIESGGTVYAGGVFTSIGGKPRDDIAALDGTTGQATSWNPHAGPPLPGYSSGVGTLALSGDTVYAGGVFGSMGGQVRHGLAAIDTATGTTTSWDPNPIWQGGGGNVRSIAVDGSTVYAGGGFDSIAGQRRRALAALDATGGSTPWNPRPSPLASFGTIRTLVTGPDGSLWAGGDFNGFPSAAQSKIARFAPVSP